MDIVRSILTTFDQPHWPESLCWGKSQGRKPHLRSLANNLSKRCLSPVPANPHHAGEGYMIEPTVVALATRWSWLLPRSWVLRSHKAKVDEAHALSTRDTWNNMECYNKSLMILLLCRHKECLCFIFQPDSPNAVPSSSALRCWTDISRITPALLFWKVWNC